ncbi:MAG: hypothetical protein H7263_09400 [Candidatus Sericytochromatia bacterium]|nr:hypothetical protein [Candidatus Sericytochromatia bacterium]
MKKILLSALLAGITVSASYTPAIAGPFDFINQDKDKKSSDSGKAVDLDKLSSGGVRLINSVGKATITFSEAAIVMLSASGNKEGAERLKVALDELKKKPNDQEGIKKFVEGAGKTAVAELEKVKVDSKTKFNLSNAELISAFEKLGGATMLDVSAVGDAGNLVKEATELLDVVAKDPMKYGFSAAGTVNSVISSGKFVTDNVPQQGKSIQGFTTKLVDYFKTNKVPVPSPERLKQIADGLQKG